MSLCLGQLNSSVDVSCPSYDGNELDQDILETCTGMTNPWSSRISGSLGLGFTLEAKFLYQIRFIVTTADVAFLHHIPTSCCSEVSCFLALGLDQLILEVVRADQSLQITTNRAPGRCGEAQVKLPLCCSDNCCVSREAQSVPASPMQLANL